MLRAFWAVVLGLACAGSCAPAQTFNLEQTRIPISALSGLWRFHTGDNPAWASPAFDDSSWALLRSDQSWFDQGFRGYAGVAWYRFRAIPAPADRSLAIFIPAINDSYQVYANGLLLGQVGRTPPSPRAVLSPQHVFRVPVGVTPAGEPVVFAIRVWRSSLLAGYSGAGSRAAPLIGDADAIENWGRYEMQRAFWELTDSHILMLVNLLTAILGLSLFALRPSEREYAWYGAAQAVWLVHSIIAVLPRFVDSPYVATYVLWLLSFKAAAVLNLEFFIALFHRKRGPLYWTGVISLAAPVMVFPLVLWGAISITQFGAINSCAFFPYALVVPFLLLPERGQSNAESKLLVIPFTVTALSIAILNAIDVFHLTRYGWIAAATAHYARLLTSPFPLSGGVLMGVLCNWAVGGVLILRFAHARRDEERLAAELEAARAVQHLLVPDEIPTVPGFAVECVYRPAGQVSGDFFQIIPLATNDAMVVIGDVSGKGMPAGLMVSLLVGTLRTALETTSSPAALLASLNRRLVERSSNAFTTCLILHVRASGIVTAANAGHLAPYLDGVELAIEPGLALGMEADTTYCETAFQMAPDQRLTMVTDGVVEARGPGGELFGFERTRAISGQPALSVAAAAQSFGQEDDITVLTLCMAPAPVLA